MNTKAKDLHCRKLFRFGRSCTTERGLADRCLLIAANREKVLGCIASAIFMPRHGFLVTVLEEIAVSFHPRRITLAIVSLKARFLLPGREVEEMPKILHKSCRDFWTIPAGSSRLMRVDRNHASGDGLCGSYPKADTGSIRRFWAYET